MLTKTLQQAPLSWVFYKTIYFIFRMIELELKYSTSVDYPLFY